MVLYSWLALLITILFNFLYEIGGDLAQKNSRPALGRFVTIKLDDATNNLLISAKNRSGRSKTNEMTIRMRDHLERFPDFYSSEYAEGVPTRKKK